MFVTLSADPVLRRIVVTPLDGACERHLVETIRTELARQPHWADWDWIYDDRGRLADLTVDGMRQAAEAFNAAASEGGCNTWSVVVTDDRYFGGWARVLDLTFRNRRHVAAPSLEAADLRLRRLRGDSPAAEATAA